jgi:formylglycine-generating enzyme required for sulfatase activity
MDGNGRDSPYTEALSQAMRSLHEPVEQVFKHVRVGVMGATANKQVPWESSSLTGDFYFAGAPSSPANISPPRTATADDSSKESSAGIGSRISGWLGLNKAPEAGKPVPAPQPIKPTPAASGNIMVAAVPVGAVPGARALPLLQSLGIANGDMDPNQNYPQAAVRQLLEHSARRVTVGNSAKQIQAALSLCQKHTTSPCKLEMFSDEKTRSITLDPYDLDTLPISVAQFRQFVDAAHYKTDAEKAGFAYAFGDQTSVPQGSWRNGIGHDVSDDAAVVGVSYRDALAYCKYKGQRLPTEDEWEFVARGPDKHTFPWGEDTSLAMARPKSAPHVADGPAEGIGGRYRGLAGNVWQWVDTEINGRKLLKGGSWLETNPAFKRAATRRYDVADRADEDSGFRCARSVSTWPDAELYAAQLR